MTDTTDNEALPSEDGPIKIATGNADEPYTRPKIDWWWLEEKLREKRKVITRLEAHITAQDEEIEEKDEIIYTLKNQCETGETIIDGLAKQLAAKDKALDVVREVALEALESVKGDLERLPKGIGRGAMSPCYQKVKQALTTIKEVE